MTRTTLALMAGLLVCALTLTGCHKKEPRAQRAASSKQQAKGPMPKAASSPKEPQPKDTRPKEERQPKEEPKPPPAPLPPLWTAKQLGIGSDQDDATQQAAKQVQDDLKRFLSLQQPPIAWTLPVDFIHKKLARSAERNVDKEEELRKKLFKNDKELPYQCWDVSFSITTKDYSEIVWENYNYLVHKQQLERDNRREERLLHEGKIVGGFLVVLLALVGYIRIDHWTRGSCSRVMRLTLVGLVIAAGMALWFTF